MFRKYIFYFLCYLIMKTNGQESPCPNIFNYVNEGYVNYGVIKIPSLYFGQSISLVVQMSLGTYMPINYTGKIEVIGNKEDIAWNMINGDMIIYKINFPLPSPVPQITSIIINNVQYCAGPPARFSSFTPYVTTIVLHHVLTTENYYGKNFNRNHNYIPQYFFEDKSKKGTYYSNPMTPTKTPYLITYPTTTQQPQEPSLDLRFMTSTTTSRTIFSTHKNTNLTLSDRIDRKDQIHNTEKCGVSSKTSPNTLIAKGESTQPGDWPWLVALFINNRQGSLKFKCAGSLISRKHILTAAHCVIEKNWIRSKISELITMLGIYDLLSWTDNSRKISVVEKIHVHPEYNRKYHNDIAILEIPRIEYTDYIKPICLWTGESKLSKIIGSSATVVGWGKEKNQDIVAPMPKKATVVIVSTDTCRNEFPLLIEYTTNKTLCAGSKDGSGPCSGDSGGGLYMSMKTGWVLRGVVSSALRSPDNEECTNLNYIVYTDTAQFMDWIKNVTDL